VAALSFDPAIWPKLPERHDILRQSLDLLIEGQPIEADLMELLGSTIEANLLDYPRRPDIWNRIPAVAREGFLRTTADGWTAKFRRTPFDTSVPEDALANIVFHTPHLQRLLAVDAAHDVAAGIHAFENFSQLDEAALQLWIDNLTRAHRVPELSDFDAKRLGVLVRAKRWTGAAQALRSGLARRRDLAPAIRECLPLFGLIDRILLRATLPGRWQPDIGEFWEALELELVAAYPHGPSEGKLWSRAGGDESVLDRGGNGRQQWHAAINLLRRGTGGKNFGVRKLLVVACSDFRRNDKLSVLEKCAEKLNL
jgi:Effector-associated domain 1